MTTDRKTAVIVGSGPAGLTAAYELLTRTNIHPVVVEKAGQVGGLARTENHHGNRIDIGGHRFFSKSDRVMSWWLSMLPIQRLSAQVKPFITYHRASRSVPIDEIAPDPEVEDKVMLVRRRKSRILFLRKLFDYPISLSLDTLSKLGCVRLIKVGMSYLFLRLTPIYPEKTLEDFLIDRFGNELYQTFFKSYTEKVWGASCREISASWGAQRIKGLSVSKVLLHALKKIWTGCTTISQKVRRRPYNNQDHSMLTAMIAVDNILSGCCSKENIWQVNTEMDYHESKAT